MNLAYMALKTSIALMVFGLGLQATIKDTTYLFRKPKLLLRTLVAMNVVLPFVSVVLAVVFDLHPAVKIALIALSISPVPPILPNKQLKAGAKIDYAFGLLVTAAVVAIISFLSRLKCSASLSAHRRQWRLVQSRCWC